MRAGAIRKARKAKGLKQHELASMLGVSQAKVSNWEIGKSVPSAAEKRALRQTLLGSSEVVGAARPEATPRGAKGETFGEWVVRNRLAKGWTQAQLASKARLSQPAISNIEIGRSPNPLASTRLLIESALGITTPLEVTELQAKAAAVPEVGVMREFDPHEPKDYPSEAGVYVFYDKSDRPIYVGESGNIGKRVRTHSEKFWFKAPIVDNASYVAITDARLRRQVEAVLLAFLRSNAVLNVQGVGATRRRGSATA